MYLRRIGCVVLYTWYESSAENNTKLGFAKDKPFIASMQKIAANTHEKYSKHFTRDGYVQSVEHGSAFAHSTKDKRTDV
jgi:hypothetical protein